MNRLPKVLLMAIVVFGLVILFSTTLHKVHSVSDHVVISEIQIAGGSSTDEFVELYNPTDGDVDLSGWEIEKLTAAGNPSNLIASMSGTITAHGYYLVTHANYDGSVTFDDEYSTGSSIAADNSVRLMNESDVVVDLVGMTGTTEYETATIEPPETHGSIERKAQLSSTIDSMLAGGMDVLEGNGEDANNNSADLLQRTIADPQNSSSPTETFGDADHTALVMLSGDNEVPPVSTTANGKTTVEIVLATNRYAYEVSYSGLSGAETGAHVHGMAAAGATADPIHTLPMGLPKHGVWNYDEGQEGDILGGLTYINIHTGLNQNGEIRGQVVFADVTPTMSPSPTPEPTEEPSPTPEPTDEPSPTPEPTEEPSPTPEPTITPEPTPMESFSFLNVTCQRRYMPFRFFGRTIYMPHIVCMPR